ncbi:30746_t:CDS:2, partial [Racocetra persica]
EKISVKALIDTISKSNTISKCLYNKLEEDYGLEDGTEMYKAKISFGHSPKTYDSYARIVIDSMSIPLIKENSNKDSSKKNNSPNSNPSPKDIEDIIRFIIHAVEKGTSHHIISDSYKYQHCHTSLHRKKKKNRKAK